ncbi:MAG TPA: response regulator [Pyrinomonadaceae bacterium]|nr:response regulator [Pyrinomonadaceae bacterium]
MSRAIILYAEDDALLRQTVSETLEMEGWEVEACEDGMAALPKLESAARFDLLLFDNVLPGIGGLELARRARILAHRRLTPLIIISASEVRAEARRAGADTFLKKPDDIGLLVETIRALLGAGA